MSQRPPGIGVDVAFRAQLQSLQVSIAQLLQSSSRTEASLIARLGDSVGDFSHQLRNMDTRRVLTALLRVG